MLCIATIFKIAIVILILSALKGRARRKIFGIYSQPGRWFWAKKFIFYCLVKLRRRKLRAPSGNETPGTTAGYGVKSRATEEEMDSLQEFSDHPKAIDAVYFNGGDKNGNRLIMSTARRPEGVINGIICIKLMDVGILVLPRMPDTLLFGEKSDPKFGAEGLLLKPVIPMKKWHLQYEGSLKLEGTNKIVQAKIDAVWTAKSKYFDFDTDMHTGAISNSMAKESWSREYFDNLKSAHQTHYEQMGSLKGIIKVDDIEYPLLIDSMRDHSYGYKREWKLIHRYIFHMFHTENGIQGNVGIVSQPITCSHLECGFITLPGGVTHPVSSVNIQLWQHGEGGEPPSDYAFSFVAGRQEYILEVEVTDTVDLYMGWDWESKIIERITNYRLNGVPAWGISEWCYRHHGGRPGELTKADPNWTKNLNKG